MEPRSTNEIRPIVTTPPQRRERRVETVGVVLVLFGFSGVAWVDAGTGASGLVTTMATVLGGVVLVLSTWYWLVELRGVHDPWRVIEPLAAAIGFVAVGVAQDWSALFVGVGAPLAALGTYFYESLWIHARRRRDSD
jgi:hypothetical protein